MEPNEEDEFDIRHVIPVDDLPEEAISEDNEKDISIVNSTLLPE